MNFDKLKLIPILLLIFFLFSTSFKNIKKSYSSLFSPLNSKTIKPSVITETTLTDTDDPAIWVNRNKPEKSLIIGTDKDSQNGGLYVFNLEGKIDSKRTVTGLKRPNNVDVAYDFIFKNDLIDIAVATERNRNCIRVFSLPDMKAIDGGGIEVFVDEEQRQPMGVALYMRSSDKKVFAIISRKSGPSHNYLEQYLLYDDGLGVVKGKLVRKFGDFSGKQEIEAVAIDNELGYIYYSDEKAGIRKYFADPEKGNEELAFFGQEDFKRDQEGISIYRVTDSTGYIIVSDQQANRFNIYPREGVDNTPHKHEKITSVYLSTIYSDGSEVTNVSLPGFPNGMFVAMSDDKTFQLYSWKEIAEKYGLKVARID